MKRKLTCVLLFALLLALLLLNRTQNAVVVRADGVTALPPEGELPATPVVPGGETSFDLPPFPPAHQPLHQDENGLLPGAAYPEPAAGGVSAFASPPQGKPDGIDLDVTHIGRTPRYSFYQLEYPNNKPALLPGTEGRKRWPARGEVVTFTAQVINKGTTASGGYAYAWYIDGQKVKSGTAASLAPGAQASFAYNWTWSHRISGERVLDNHTVRFTVDPANQIPETFESNNQLTELTNALSLLYVITPDVYALLETPALSGLSFSAEDWLQKQMKTMNDALAQSKYYVAPTGSVVQLRLDKIIVSTSNIPRPLGYDGAWFMDADYRAYSGYYDPATDIDWGLVHELSHQIGLIDLYQYNLEQQHIQVTRQDGTVYDDPYRQDNFDIMFGGSTVPYNDHHLYSAHSAAGMKRTAGYRRGYYGEYQYDLSPQVNLEVRTGSGCAVNGVAVSIYQRDRYSGFIDNTPEIQAATNANGAALLPNRSVGGSLTTRTGHTLHNNPFGIIDVVGTGNMFLVKLQKDGYEDFHWLPITYLNEQYWGFRSPPSQTVVYRWDHPYQRTACSSGKFNDEFDLASLQPKWLLVDPGQDARLSLGDQRGVLRLQAARGGNDLYPGSNLDAPRLLQNVQGDFDLKTRLTVKPAYGYQGAGIVLWQDENNYLRLERALHDGQGVYLWYRLGGVYQGYEAAETSLDTLHLRLKRIGNNFRGYSSANGSSWTLLFNLNLAYQSSLQAGLALVNEWQDHFLQADFYWIHW